MRSLYLTRDVGKKFGAGGQPAMASAVWRANPLWSWKTFFICTCSRSVKFVIFSVYLQYFARASMVWLFSAQWRSHVALLARPASVSVCLGQTCIVTLWPRGAT